MNDKDFDKALDLRGPEFMEMLLGFRAVSSLKDDNEKLPVNKVYIFL